MVERSVELTTRGASNRGSRQGFECIRSKLWTWGDVLRTFFRLFATFLTRILSHFWVRPWSNAHGSWGDPLKSLAGTNQFGGLNKGVGLFKSTVWTGGMFRAHFLNRFTPLFALFLTIFLAWPWSSARGSWRDPLNSLAGAHQPVVFTMCLRGVGSE